MHPLCTCVLLVGAKWLQGMQLSLCKRTREGIPPCGVPLRAQSSQMPRLLVYVDEPRRRRARACGAGGRYEAPLVLRARGHPLCSMRRNRKP